MDCSKCYFRTANAECSIGTIEHCKIEEKIEDIIINDFLSEVIYRNDKCRQCCRRKKETDIWDYYSCDFASICIAHNFDYFKKTLDKLNIV